MSIELVEVVPWGRSFDEYRGMFALGDGDLGGRILGCADGPASFNAEARERGLRVVSCDPLYDHDAARIEARVAATREDMLRQLRAARAEYVWRAFRSPEQLAEARVAAARRFLADLDSGARAGRYVAGALPRLPFPDHAFDLALCSHFLFLYSAQLSLDFHLAALRELCRVAREVRVFPLQDLARARSPHLEPVLAGLRAAGLVARVEPVPYEFQRGATEMLRVLDIS
jgi:hypothetical protein